MSNFNETNGNNLVRPLTGRLMYILAIAVFFFTFFNLRCGTARMARISGVTMATGGEAKLMPDLSEWIDEDFAKDSSTATNENLQKQFFGKKDTIRVPVNFWALTAMVAIIVAFMVSLSHTVKGYWVQMGSAGVAILSLLGMIFTRHLYALKLMNLDIPLLKREGNLFGQQVVLTLSPSWALWLALGTLAAALYIAMMMQRRLKIELENQAALEHFNPGNEDLLDDLPPG